MTEQHPLTDKICLRINKNSSIIDVDDWRTYMRVGADWQLEQDAKYFDQYLIMLGFDPEIAKLRAKWFKEKMRSQVVDLPQANSDACGEEGIERARQRTFEENDELMRKLSDS